MLRFAEEISQSVNLYTSFSDLENNIFFLMQLKWGVLDFKVKNKLSLRTE